MLRRSFELLAYYVAVVMSGVCVCVLIHGGRLTGGNDEVSILLEARPVCVSNAVSAGLRDEDTLSATGRPVSTHG